MAAKIRAPHSHALRRKRLDDLVETVWEHRLGLVIAPAGSGKTTLLSTFATRTDCPVAWTRAEPSDGAATTFLACLEAALTAALPNLRGGWRRVEDAARALEERAEPRILFIVDDLHTLQGTPAEQTLARLIDYAPPALTVMVGSRSQPALGLSRLRLAGALLEIGPEELRFRSWEVEQLFRDVYDEPLPPEEMGAVARRTEGWAAGLQLYHLATRGKQPIERRHTLEALGGRARLMREYLTDNVLTELRPDLRAFLLGTCVLGRLSGRVCDELLGRSGSDGILAELERTRMFTVALADGWYRYHEILRSHLEAVLVETHGEEAARARYHRAAALLETAGALPEALAAYCRAEDWQATARILGDEGESLALGPGVWLDRLPAGLLDQDPWLLLASARRHRAAGRWRTALTTFRCAERLFGALPAGEVCRRERIALAAWAGPTFDRRDDWLSRLRTATRGDPWAAVGAAGNGSADGGAGGLLARGLATLLAGNVWQARVLLEDAASRADASPELSLAARLGAGVAKLLTGDNDAAIDVEWVAEDAERVGATWLSQLSQALLALTGTPQRVDAAVRIGDTAREADPWGGGLAAIAAGIGLLQHVEAAPAALEAAEGRLGEAAEGFAALSASTLVGWCRAVAVGLRARREAAAADLASEAQTTLAMLRAIRVRGPQLYTRLALAAADPLHAISHRAEAGRVAIECGLRITPEPRRSPAPTEPVSTGAPGAPSGADNPVSLVASAARFAEPPALELRCFGGLRIAIEGRPLDLGELRPQTRTLLRLLALHAGRPVHWESLVAVLWPDVGTDSGRRSLHVALSGLRRTLEPDAGRGRWSLLVRDGDAYQLAVPAGAVVDVLAFDRAVADGRLARAAGDDEAARAAWRTVLDLHHDDLLPEEGPAEWVAVERERCRADAAEAAQRLSDLLVTAGDWSGAVAVCEHGLRIDRYRDGLWRSLIAAHETGGQRAAAAHARRRYDHVLAELGVV